MRVGVLGVPEDGVGDPNEPHHVTVEGQDLCAAVVPQTSVDPRLRKYDVDLVLLSKKFKIITGD